MMRIKNCGFSLKQSTNLHAKNNEKEYGESEQISLKYSGLDQMRLPFAYKLHILLSDMEYSGCEHIISWVECGAAFKIHDKEKFEKLIQPCYFRQSKIASFIRQCYMYGFTKVEGEPCRGSYIHHDFHKTDLAKALTIKRLSSVAGGRRCHHLNRSQFTEALSRSSSTVGRKVNLPPKKPPTSSSLSSSRQIVSRHPSPTPSMISNSSVWDSVLQDPTFVPKYFSWPSEPQQAMLLTEEHNDDASMDEFLFEPRPIEIMLRSCSSSSVDISFFVV